MLWRAKRSPLLGQSLPRPPAVPPDQGGVKGAVAHPGGDTAVPPQPPRLGGARGKPRVCRSEETAGRTRGHLRGVGTARQPRAGTGVASDNRKAKEAATDCANWSPARVTALPLI